MKHETGGPNEEGDLLLIISSKSWKAKMERGHQCSHSEGDALYTKTLCHEVFPIPTGKKISLSMGTLRLLLTEMVKSELPSWHHAWAVPTAGADKKERRL